MTLDGTGNYTGGTFFDNALMVPDGGECNWPPDSERGDNGLDECEHVCAVAYRLPDKRRKSDSGDLWDQSAAGRWQHVYGRRCRRMLDGIAPGSECAEQHDCGTAERELDEPGGGGCGQCLQQLDDGRDDVYRRS